MSDEFTTRELAGVFDVPPWLIDPAVRRPRFARLQWALRRRGRR